jgi:hypothetical protein
MIKEGIDLAVKLAEKLNSGANKQKSESGPRAA